MAISAVDRYRILQNIVAQKGTDSVDLHAELAKAESMVNVWDTQKMMQPPPQPMPADVEQPPQAPTQTNVTV